MKFGRLFSLAVLTVATLFLAATESKANWNFTASTVTTPQTLGAVPNTSVISFGPTASVLPSNSGSASGTFVTISDIVAGTGATGSVVFTTTVTISQVLPDAGGIGSGTLSFVGTLNFSKSDTTGEVSTFTLGALSAPLNIGGEVYTFAAGSFGYTQPTVNVPIGTSGAGGVSATINVANNTGVPEPASVVMLGTGIMGILALGRYRKRNARA